MRGSPNFLYGFCGDGQSFIPKRHICKKKGYVGKYPASLSEGSGWFNFEKGRHGRAGPARAWLGLARKRTVSVRSVLASRSCCAGPRAPIEAQARLTRLTTCRAGFTMCCAGFVPGFGSPSKPSPFGHLYRQVLVLTQFARNRKDEKKLVGWGQRLKSWSLEL